MFHRSDTVDDAYSYLTSWLTENVLNVTEGLGDDVRNLCAGAANPRRKLRDLAAVACGVFAFEMLWPVTSSAR